MENKINSNPLWIKIISPSGLIFDSSSKGNLSISSIVARGVIPSKGSYENLRGEAAFDFEILPDHSPFVAKVAPKSSIRLTSKPSDMKFDTDFGGVVTVSYTDNHTLATFTMQDVKIPNVKNK
jgi:hypothetical protein